MDLCWTSCTEFEESLNSAYLDYCGFLEQVFKRFKGFHLKLTQSKLLSRAFYLKTQTIINIFCFMWVTTRIQLVSKSDLGLAARPRSFWRSCLCKMVVSKSHFCWKRNETKTATAATTKAWHQSDIREILRLLLIGITKEFLEIRNLFFPTRHPTHQSWRLSPQHLLSLSQKLGEERRAEAAQMAIDAAKLFAKDKTEKTSWKLRLFVYLFACLLVWKINVLQTDETLIISKSSLFS